MPDEDRCQTFGMTFVAILETMSYFVRRPNPNKERGINTFLNDGFKCLADTDLPFLNLYFVIVRARQ
ncbi:MAG TPA: hypothetical protein ENI52_00005 [Thermoplasmata archaeon]|nr:hypothetical protein [Thermoplasmata archaeon]